MLENNNKKKNDTIKKRIITQKEQEIKDEVILKWDYNNNSNVIKIISIDDIPEEYKNAIGFIYQITQISTGKSYIGRKMLYENKTTQKKGIKTKNKVETDWKNYFSSSDELKQLKEDIGIDDFKREILVFCFTKSQMIYAEECLLYHVDSLLKPEWFNNNIRSKIYKSWFNNPKKKKENDLFLNDITKAKNK